MLEAEAILDGDARHFWNAMYPVPAWVYLNELAHGDAWAVRRLSAHLPAQEDWDGVVALVADEMLRLAGGDASLVLRVQRECLIPLELALLGNGSAGRAWTPRVFLQACHARLACHPLAHRPHDA